MKNIMLYLIMLLSMNSIAQNFEGTIKWSVQSEITDPAMKAKMEQASKKMNDQATQAKMKEMQAKMNDPQMKAMMDANPQMKAQMENAMKMMQGGDMTSMIPKSFTIKMKNKNTLTKMEGGPMEMEVLYLEDKGQSYHLNRSNRTYSIMDSGNPKKNPSAPRPKITKTTEVKKILNYNCIKYVAEITEGNRTIMQSFWTTAEIKDIDLKSLAKQRMGQGQSIFYEGVEGVPLRIEMSMPQATMMMEVIEIRKETLKQDDFVIPADFTETKGPGQF
jgi:Domain of unknown function (DUF4412)